MPRSAPPGVRWAPAKGYEATHDVSACGRLVRSRRTGRLLKRTRDGRVLLVTSLAAPARRWAYPHDLAPAGGRGGKQTRVSRIALGVYLAAATTAAVASLISAIPSINQLVVTDAAAGVFRDGGGPFFYADGGM